MHETLRQRLQVAAGQGRNPPLRMGDKPLRLSDLLRASAPLGAPVELLLDSWAAVEDAVLADSGHAREDFAAASDALPAIAGAIADRRALAAAVMTARGEVCFADAAYRALFPDSRDLRPLLKRGLREGPLVSLVEGTAGAAFTAWTSPRSRPGWPRRCCSRPTWTWPPPMPEWAARPPATRCAASTPRPGCAARPS